jgi:hypothetical protein
MGFDELLMKATSANSANTNDNALALDNVKVMLANLPPAPVIYGSDFSVDLTTGVPSLTVWDTIPGCEYRLVYKEDLAAPTWNSSLNEWQAGGGILMFSDPSAPGKPRRCYCVEVR